MKFAGGEHADLYCEIPILVTSSSFNLPDEEVLELIVPETALI